jgi:hypothetical protein
MTTFEEMINEFGGSPQAEPQEPTRRTIWQQIKDEWPPLIPPPLPLTLEKAWQYILLDDPAPPSAEELAAEAAKEDREYPECHGALYRRSHPDWLENDVAIYTELSHERRWGELERCLDGGLGLPDERRDWLLRHEDVIRPLIAAAKAEHVAHYGGGWLKRALARIAEHRHP